MPDVSQVSATRKGLKNQLKNLWWRKGKDDAPDVQTGPVYTFSSMESQIRVLADYAFMLRDYDLALSNYRLLSSDYKTDKAWKHYAGVQEMIGLCLFMLDQSRREAEMCLDTAYNYYQVEIDQSFMTILFLLQTKFYHDRNFRKTRKRKPMGSLLRLGYQH
jgi:hypothetical protein